MGDKPSLALCRRMARSWILVESTASDVTFWGTTFRTPGKFLEAEHLEQFQAFAAPVVGGGEHHQSLLVVESDERLAVPAQMAHLRVDHGLAVRSFDWPRGGGAGSLPVGRESVDGVGISLDNPNLRSGSVRTTVQTGWRATTRHWTGRNGEDTMTVSVQRGTKVSSQNWWDSLSGGEVQPAIIAGLRGNLLELGASTTTRTFVWIPEFGLAVVVTAPAPDLRRIMEDITVP
ncbi:hypothetical protein [Nonomuraea sp. NPDC049709]|uniref:hypothetical protein n=1 Tax=Nonomuraea sp. NPDC049709 TaxID=3154736 RepID=UPI0034179359